jgi:hypothetical protein
MFTKRLITATVAAVIAVGAATAASAHGPGPIHFHGPGKDVMKDFNMKDFKKDFGKKQHHDDFHSGWGFPGMFFMNFGSRKVCTPVYDDEWVWHPWKGWVLETVKVGEKCKPQPYGFNFGW